MLKKPLYRRYLVMLLCIALLCPYFMTILQEGLRVSAAPVEAKPVAGICTANELNIRSGPGTSYAKVSASGVDAYLVKNQEVEILGEEDGWYQIRTSFNGESVTGYCLGTYIKVTAVATPTPTATPIPTATPTPSATPTPAVITTVEYKLSLAATVTASSLNLREAPNTDSTVIKTLKNGAALTVTGEKVVDGRKWYKVSVKVDGKTQQGYVVSEYVAFDLKTAFYATAKDTLTIYKTAGKSTLIKDSDGKAVEIPAEKLLYVSKEETVNGEKWFYIRVTISGTKYYGYVRGNDITLQGERVTTTVTPTPTPEPTATPVPETITVVEYKLSLAATVTASQLNLRKEANTSSDIIKTLTRGAALTVIGEETVNGQKWYQVSAKIDSKTQQGYVLSDYVQLDLKKAVYVSANGKINLYEEAGGSGKVTDASGNTVEVPNKKYLYVTEEKTAGGEKWFYARVTVNDTKYNAYVKAADVKLVGERTTTTITVTPTPTPKPTATPAPSATPTPEPIDAEEDFQYSGVVTANTLNLRKDAVTTASILSELKKDVKVKVLNEVDKEDYTWYRLAVTVDGKTVIGYAVSPYIKLDTENNTIYATVTGGSLKLRKKSDAKSTYVTTESGNILSIAEEERVLILEEITKNSAKWFKVQYTSDGVEYEGYTLASRLNLTAPPAPTATPTPTPKPTATPTPTSAPEASATPQPTSAPDATPTPEAATPTPTPITDPQQGMLKEVTALALKQEPKYGSKLVKNENGFAVVVQTEAAFDVLEFVDGGDMVWCYVRVKSDEIEYFGYINAEYVVIVESDSSLGEPDEPVEPVEPVEPTVTPGAADSGDFEELLNAQNFPESYKALLRVIHEEHPSWQFVAYHTGLDWEEVIANESLAGKNLIPNSKNLAWKSLEENAYNWKTDSFIVYDGSTWVTASEAAIRYYMDPRNFLDSTNIFQFELLTYEPEYQTLEAVESILNNTAMSQTVISFTENGVEKSMSYGEIFMEAAVYSGVSPLHLASRVKQEVVTGTTTMSNSVSGTVSGFEGLYNFYNIGAYHSTVAGGAIANGLKYAKNGSTNAALNLSMLIPWNNPYRAILGGAYYIGYSYINRGQNTIYLQKFNVTSTSTYSHQYMANVEAPYSEGRKVAAAYEEFGELPLVFSIPVYLNMPEETSPIPTTASNPNNWLKTLAVKDANGNSLSLTPTFDLTVDQEYYLILDNTYEFIELQATAVSNKAVVEGTGWYVLSSGNNVFTIYVMAENGDVREYKLTIARSE